MAWYKTGTITMTQNSTAVVGVGTDFLKNVVVGSMLLAPNGVGYEIASITDSLNLQLGAPYQGPTISGASYSIVPTQSYIPQLTQMATTLLNTFGPLRDAYNAGAFASGSDVSLLNNQALYADRMGLKGDGKTDDSAALLATVTFALANKISTIVFSSKNYYFANPVKVVLDSLGISIRFVGTHVPSFSGYPSTGTIFTGASGVDSLILLTKTDVTKAGYCSFSCENIAFRGAGIVGSGIKNVVAGGPSRPFVVRACTFQGFTLAGITSDTSATGLATGICQAHIYDNNFSGNKYAIYGKGQAAIMGIDFHSNVCEQNSSGAFYSGTGSFQGTIRISDNLLEGQPNPIQLSVGLGVVEIARNYFEANTGCLINITAVNPATSVKIEPNFIYNCSGTTVNIGSVSLDCRQDFQAYGVTLQLNAIYGKSKINNEGVVSPSGSYMAIALDPASVQMKTLAPANSLILNGRWVEFSGIKSESPAGFIGVSNFTGTTPKISTGISVSANDWVVMMALVRFKTLTTPNGQNITAFTWDGATGNEIAQTDPTIGTGGFGNNEWAFVCRAMSCPTATNNLQISWTSTASADITDTYVYRLSQATQTTPMPIFLPPTGLVPSNYYAQTSSSGSTSIVDTGIAFNTPEVGFNTGAVYQLCVTGWLNPQVNDTSGTVIGLIVINTVIQNQLLYQQITFQQTAAVPATGGLTASAVFWNGTTESVISADNNSACQIRLKISGYNSSFPGYFQKMTLNKVL